ncbi:hypothetical protein MRB53_013415 [Persea americana]|uniref:Uncharacterized protein n=1 Tax=Persea americana TaxID=3435 RepID=A0ACC2K7X5_PERAE|nr:hypothetical protein MRB53_013415 [Persea americana]
MDALALMQLKALFFFPSYALSLIAALKVFSSTALSLSGKRPTWLTTITFATSRTTALSLSSKGPTWLTAITSVTSSTWKRLFLTSAYQNLMRVAMSHLLSTSVGV